MAWRPGAWRRAVGALSNLNAGWAKKLHTPDDLIKDVLTEAEPEGGIIGTAKGNELREMVNGR